MMHNDLIHDIKTRLDLRALVEADLGPGKRSDPALRWPCPFHQGDNPTALAVERGRFRCWVCEVKGDLFDWLRQYHGLDFRAALVRAAELAGVAHLLNGPAGHGTPPAGHGDARPTRIDQLPSVAPASLGRGKPTNLDQSPPVAPASPGRGEPTNLDQSPPVAPASPGRGEPTNPVDTPNPAGHGDARPTRIDQLPSVAPASPCRGEPTNLDQSPPVAPASPGRGKPTNPVDTPNPAGHGDARPTRIDQLPSVAPASPGRGEPTNLDQSPPVAPASLCRGKPTIRAPHRPDLTPPDPAWQQRHHPYVMLCQSHLWKADHLAALDYLRQQRGLSDETIRAAILGYDPQRRFLTLPWYWRFADGHNSLWRVSAKSLVDGRKQPPFAGFKPGLYHGYALDPTKPALLVEGEIDALTALQEAGDLIVPVATGGASSGREATWLTRLCHLPLVLVAFDNDRAGEQGAAWWCRHLPNARRLRPMGAKDVNEMHVQGVSVSTWIAAALEQLPALKPEVQTKSARWFDRLWEHLTGGRGHGG